MSSIGTVKDIFPAGKFFQYHSSREWLILWSDGTRISFPSCLNRLGQSSIRYEIRHLRLFKLSESSEPVDIRFCNSFFKVALESNCPSSSGCLSWTTASLLLSGSEDDVVPFSTVFLLRLVKKLSTCSFRRGLLAVPFSCGF